jgi:hypothetical protein
MRERDVSRETPDKRFALIKPYVLLVTSGACLFQVKNDIKE